MRAKVFQLGRQKTCYQRHTAASFALTTCRGCRSEFIRCAAVPRSCQPLFCHFYSLGVHALSGRTTHPSGDEITSYTNQLTVSARKMSSLNTTTNQARHLDGARNGRKRTQVNLACNECRRRKVKVRCPCQIVRMSLLYHPSQIFIPYFPTLRTRLGARRDHSFRAFETLHSKKSRWRHRLQSAVKKVHLADASQVSPISLTLLVRRPPTQVPAMLLEELNLRFLCDC